MSSTWLPLADAEVMQMIASDNFQAAARSLDSVQNLGGPLVEMLADGAAVFLDGLWAQTRVQLQQQMRIDIAMAPTWSYDRVTVANAAGAVRLLLRKAAFDAALMPSNKDCSQLLRLLRSACFDMPQAKAGLLMASDNALMAGVAGLRFVEDARRNFHDWLCLRPHTAADGRSGSAAASATGAAAAAATGAAAAGAVSAVRGEAGEPSAPGPPLLESLARLVREAPSEHLERRLTQMLPIASRLAILAFFSNYTDSQRDLLATVSAEDAVDNGSAAIPPAAQALGEPHAQLVKAADQVIEAGFARSRSATDAEITAMPEEALRACFARVEAMSRITRGEPATAARIWRIRAVMSGRTIACPAMRMRFHAVSQLVDMTNSATAGNKVWLSSRRLVAILREEGVLRYILTSGSLNEVILERLRPLFAWCASLGAFSGDDVRLLFRLGLRSTHEHTAREVGRLLDALIRAEAARMRTRAPAPLARSLHARLREQACSGVLDAEVLLLAAGGGQTGAPAAAATAAAAGSEAGSSSSSSSSSCGGGGGTGPSGHSRAVAAPAAAAAAGDTASEGRAGEVVEAALYCLRDYVNQRALAGELAASSRSASIAARLAGARAALAAVQRSAEQTMSAAAQGSLLVGPSAPGAADPSGVPAGLRTRALQALAADTPVPPAVVALSASHLGGMWSAGRVAAANLSVGRRWNSAQGLTRLLLRAEADWLMIDSSGTSRTPAGAEAVSESSPPPPAPKREDGASSPPSATAGLGTAPPERGARKRSRPADAASSPPPAGAASGAAAQGSGPTAKRPRPQPSAEESIASGEAAGSAAPPQGLAARWTREAAVLPPVSLVHDSRWHAVVEAALLALERGVASLLEADALREHGLALRAFLADTTHSLLLAAHDLAPAGALTPLVGQPSKAALESRQALLVRSAPLFSTVPSTGLDPVTLAVLRRGAGRSSRPVVLAGEWAAWAPASAAGVQLKRWLSTRTSPSGLFSAPKRAQDEMCCLSEPNDELELALRDPAYPGFPCAADLCASQVHRLSRPARTTLVSSTAYRPESAGGDEYLAAVSCPFVHAVLCLLVDAHGGDCDADKAGLGAAMSSLLALVGVTIKTDGEDSTGKPTRSAAALLEPLDADAWVAQSEALPDPDQLWLELRCAAASLSNGAAPSSEVARLHVAFPGCARLPADPTAGCVVVSRPGESVASVAGSGGAGTDFPRGVSELVLEALTLPGASRRPRTEPSLALASKLQLLLNVCCRFVQLGGPARRRELHVGGAGTATTSSRSDASATARAVGVMLSAGKELMLRRGATASKRASSSAGKESPPPQWFDDAVSSPVEAEAAVFIASRLALEACQELFADAPVPHFLTMLTLLRESQHRAPAQADLCELKEGLREELASCMAWFREHGATCSLSAFAALVSVWLLHGTLTGEPPVAARPGLQFEPPSRQLTIPLVSVPRPDALDPLLGVVLGGLPDSSALALETILALAARSHRGSERRRIRGLLTASALSLLAAPPIHGTHKDGAAAEAQSRAVVMLSRLLDMDQMLLLGPVTRRQGTQPLLVSARSQRCAWVEPRHWAAASSRTRALTVQAHMTPASDGSQPDPRFQLLHPPQVHGAAAVATGNPIRECIVDADRVSALPFVIARAAGLPVKVAAQALVAASRFTASVNKPEALVPLPAEAPVYDTTARSVSQPVSSVHVIFPAPSDVLAQEDPSADGLAPQLEQLGVASLVSSGDASVVARQRWPTMEVFAKFVAPFSVVVGDEVVVQPLSARCLSAAGAVEMWSVGSELAHCSPAVELLLAVADGTPSTDSFGFLQQHAWHVAARRLPTCWGALQAAAAMGPADWERLFLAGPRPRIGAPSSAAVLASSPSTAAAAAAAGATSPPDEPASEDNSPPPHARASPKCWSAGGAWGPLRVAYLLGACAQLARPSMVWPSWPAAQTPEQWRRAFVENGGLSACVRFVAADEQPSLETESASGLLTAGVCAWRAAELRAAVLNLINAVLAVPRSVASDAATSLSGDQEASPASAGAPSARDAGRAWLGSNPRLAQQLAAKLVDDFGSISSAPSLLRGLELAEERLQAPSGTASESPTAAAAPPGGLVPRRAKRPRSGEGEDSPVDSAAAAGGCSLNPAAARRASLAVELGRAHRSVLAASMPLLAECTTAPGSGASSSPGASSAVSLSPATVRRVVRSLAVQLDADAPHKDRAPAMAGQDLAFDRQFAPCALADDSAAVHALSRLGTDLLSSCSAAGADSLLRAAVSGVMLSAESTMRGRCPDSAAVAELASQVSPATAASKLQVAQCVQAIMARSPELAVLVSRECGAALLDSAASLKRAGAEPWLPSAELLALASAALNAAEATSGDGAALRDLLNGAGSLALAICGPARRLWVKGGEPCAHGTEAPGGEGGCTASSSSEDMSELVLLGSRKSGALAAVDEGTLAQVLSAALQLASHAAAHLEGAIDDSFAAGLVGSVMTRLVCPAAHDAVTEDGRLVWPTTAAAQQAEDVAVTLVAHRHLGAAASELVSVFTSSTASCHKLCLKVVEATLSQLLDETPWAPLPARMMAGSPVEALSPGPSSGEPGPAQAGIHAEALRAAAVAAEARDPPYGCPPADPCFPAGGVLRSGSSAPAGGAQPFVGLVNQGGTCYMNSLLQQLFMIPRLRHAVLRSTPPPDRATPAELYPTSKWAGQLDALRRQFQRVIASLCALSSQSLQTLPFVRACVNDPPGFMPLESNILDQNDANEFFSVLVDRLGEALPRPSPHLEDMVGDSPEPVPLLLSSGTGERVGAAPDLVTSIVGGAFVHQIISTDPAAPFYSERREPFVCLSVDVKDSSDLASCLRSFVADDLLTGDNAFRADDYDSKIDVRKRCVLSELPDVLVVHLKRFDLDFTTFERVKLNNTVSFPDELDLWPFTLAGAPGSTDVVDQIRGLREHIASSLATQEAAQSAAGAGAAASAAAAAPSTARPHDVVALRARLAEVDELARRLATSASTTSREHCKYRLSGVLIHIGTATAGHYFSFVRERQCDVLARLRGMPRGSSVLPAPSSDDGEGSDVVEAGEWLLFNDESVERVPMGDAQRASQWFGSARSTQSAFMLFYDRQASAAAPAGPSASKPDVAGQHAQASSSSSSSSSSAASAASAAAAPRSPQRARRASADERPAQRLPPTSPPGSGCRAVPVAAPAGMTLDAAELTGCSRRAMTLATGTAADALGCSILAVLAANLHDTEAAFAAACGSAAGSGAAPPPAPSVPLREDIEPLMDAATRMLVAGEPHSIDANALTSGILANAHALALAWPLHGAGCLCVRGVRRATALLNGPAGRWLPAADAAAIHRLLSRSMVRGSSKQLGLHTPSNAALRRAARVAAAVATSLQGDPTALRPSVRRELEQALLARGGTLSGSVGHCQLARGILSVGSIPRRISATARLVVSRLQGTAMSGVQRLLDGGAPSRWRAATGMLARVARALNAVACAAGVTLRPPTEWFLLSPQPSVETEAPATPASPALDSRAAAPRLAGGLLPKASAVRERLGLGGSSGAAGSSGSGACESSADLLDLPLGGSASSSASSDRLRSGYSATVALSEIAELAVAVLADAMGGRNDSICLGAGIATALFQGGPVAAAAGLRHRLPELVVAIHFANAPNVPTELDRFCHGGLLFFNETQKPQVVDPISGGDSAAVGEGALGLSDVLPSLPISVAAEFGGVGTRTAASALRFFNPLPVPLEQAALRPADSPIMRDVLQRTVALAIRAGRVHDSAVCVDGDGALRDEAQRSFDGWQPPPRSPQTAPSSLPWPISAAAGAGAAEAAPAGPAKCGLSPGRHPAVASSAAVSAGEWLRAASMAGAARAALRVLSHSCERWRAGDVAALRARLRQHAASSFSRAGGLVARAGSDRFRADRRRVGDGVLRGVAVASTLAELEAMVGGDCWDFKPAPPHRPASVPPATLAGSKPGQGTSTTPPSAAAPAAEVEEEEQEDAAVAGATAGPAAESPDGGAWPRADAAIAAAVAALADRAEALIVALGAEPGAAAAEVERRLTAALQPPPPPAAAAGGAAAAAGPPPPLDARCGAEPELPLPAGAALALVRQHRRGAAAAAAVLGLDPVDRLRLTPATAIRPAVAAAMRMDPPFPAWRPADSWAGIDIDELPVPAGVGAALVPCYCPVESGAVMGLIGPPQAACPADLAADALGAGLGRLATPAGAGFGWGDEWRQFIPDGSSARGAACGPALAPHTGAFNEVVLHSGLVDHLLFEFASECEAVDPSGFCNPRVTAMAHAAWSNPWMSAALVTMCVRAHQAKQPPEWIELLAQPLLGVLIGNADLAADGLQSWRLHHAFSSGAALEGLGHSSAGRALAGLAPLLEHERGEARGGAASPAMAADSDGEGKAGGNATQATAAAMEALVGIACLSTSAAHAATGERSPESLLAQAASECAGATLDPAADSARVQSLLALAAAVDVADATREARFFRVASDRPPLGPRPVREMVGSQGPEPVIVLDARAVSRAHQLRLSVAGWPLRSHPLASTLASLRGAMAIARLPHLVPALAFTSWAVRSALRAAKRHDTQPDPEAVARLGAGFPSPRSLGLPSGRRCCAGGSASEGDSGPSRHTLPFGCGGTSSVVGHAINAVAGMPVSAESSVPPGAGSVASAVIRAMGIDIRTGTRPSEADPPAVPRLGPGGPSGSFASLRVLQAMGLALCSDDDAVAPAVSHAVMEFVADAVGGRRLPAEQRSPEARLGAWTGPDAVLRAFSEARLLAEALAGAEAAGGEAAAASNDVLAALGQVAATTAGAAPLPLKMAPRDGYKAIGRANAPRQLGPFAKNPPTVESARARVAALGAWLVAGTAAGPARAGHAARPGALSDAPADGSARPVPTLASKPLLFAPSTQAVKALQAHEACSGGDSGGGAPSIDAAVWEQLLSHLKRSPPAAEGLPSARYWELLAEAAGWGSSNASCSRPAAVAAEVLTAGPIDALAAAIDAESTVDQMQGLPQDAFEAESESDAQSDASGEYDAAHN